MTHNAHMYEIVGGLRASLLSAVKTLATGSGVDYTHINPQYFIHDVSLRNLFRYYSYISTTYPTQCPIFRNLMIIVKAITNICIWWKSGKPPSPASLIYKFTQGKSFLSLS